MGTQEREAVGSAIDAGVAAVQRQRDRNMAEDRVRQIVMMNFAADAGRRSMRFDSLATSSGRTLASRLDAAKVAP